jgi:Mn-dependent DtxR family transcriptional regulator
VVGMIESASTRLHDLAGADHFALTQEYLARMIGVRRTSVSEVAGELQKKGMISYSRGRLHIQDIERIRETSCECHEELNDHYERLVQRIPSNTRLSNDQDRH